MQYPVGMEFNPDTVRNEMIDFWALLLSPVAINKFFHTVISSWVVGALFVTGISAWFLLRKREVDFALKSIKVAAIFGLVATILVAVTGDGSAYHVTQQQPMKLAAMEGLYKGKSDAGLVAFGVLKPGKRAYNDPSDPYLFKIEIPGMLSLLGNREMGSFVPGIQDIIDGGYQTKNGVALSFAEKQAKGKLAIQSLGDYQKAMAAKDTVKAAGYKAKLKANYAQFGYGYIEKAETLIPHVPTVFYSFHLMVILGMYFIVFFIVVLIFQNNGKLEKTKWLLWVAVLSIPLGYLASQLGWVVAEVDRQPWAIQDVLPVNAAISNLSASSVIITFFLFLILFSALLVAEIRIMLNQIKKVPSAH